ncbi:unnamed protein product [Coregonus sp. 'balchen']|nr:unnamed protein product [Coregonus sp. 'balchen']
MTFDPFFQNAQGVGVGWRHNGYRVIGDLDSALLSPDRTLPRLKGAEQCQHRRPGVAVPTSKARRRSSVGLPSAGLVQRRRSSVGLPFTGPVGRRRSSVGLSPTAQAQRRRSSVGLPSGYVGRRRSSVGLACAAHKQRRRSSEVQGLPQVTGGHCCHGGGPASVAPAPPWPVSTLASLSAAGQAAKLRTIDTHLLGPSMLLASLVQMSEEQQRGAQGGEGGQLQALRAAPSQRGTAAVRETVAPGRRAAGVNKRGLRHRHHHHHHIQRERGRLHGRTGIRFIVWQP